MKKIYLIGSVLLLSVAAKAQLSIPTTGVPVNIDFSGFSGAGFQPGGGGGTLNSDEWIVTGLSEGDIDFGATAITGDYARGTTMGLVTTGGVYGVDIAGNQGLMIQPTADDFTPGSFTLKIENNTGTDIGELALAYTIYVLNDAGRSNAFNFSVSYDNITYSPIVDLDYISPEAMDFTPYIENKSTNITGLTIPDGAVFFLRWTGDDVGGSGSRDEFALDDISITAIEGEPLVLATFDPAGVIIDEDGGTATGNISLSGDTDCELIVSVNAGSTADGTDYTFADFSVSFVPGDPTDYAFEIPVTDDIVDESDETLILDLTYIAGTCAVGLPSTYTLLIVDNDDAPLPLYTAYDIAEINGENVDGVANSLDELVDLTGVVYGINTWDGGLQFTLIDNTGGINVFSFDNDFGYSVTEGDEINVLGSITQFNGLIEVEPDTVIFIDGGNTLKTAVATTALNESTESDLVHITGELSYVDITQWLGDGTSFNVDLTDGVNTYTIRIDNNNELATLPAPALAGLYYLDVTGIGSQFDTDMPYTSGYQLFPRYADDIKVVAVESIENAAAAGIQVYPNPAMEYIVIDGLQQIESVEVINQIGEVVLFINAVSGNKIDLNTIAAGLYTLKIKTNTGVYASQLVKQ